MSEVSPKQQLMIARQQLDKLSIFIASLADYFYGTSPNIDADFQAIKKLLSGKPDYDQAATLCAGLNAQLKQESKYLKQKNADNLSQIQNSLRQVAQLDAVNVDVKAEIRVFMQSLAPCDTNNSVSAVSHFEKALSLFKKALSNNVVVANHNEDMAQKDLHEKITRELKELIAPYFKKDNNNNALTQINQKLNEGLGHKELLECCLVMIRFVIKDVLNEASGATKLIHDIHKSLTKINQGIKTTIVKSQQRLDKREAQNKVMTAQISAMESVLSDTNEITDLKRHTTEYLAQLQNDLQMSAQEERGEQEKVIMLLQGMQKRLEELELQADTYKNKLLQQRINAMTDTLTKLPNRLAYDEKIEAEYKRASLSNKRIFMAIFDIDHFKRINDKYGHSVGDKTLQIIANHIQKYLAKDDFVSRWGGEEFVALLFDNELLSAFNKLEALREKIAKLPFKFKGERVSVTLSIGLSELTSHSSIQDAFNETDALLFKAKEGGRNKTCSKENT